MGGEEDPSFLDYIEEEDSAFFQQLKSNLDSKKKEDDNETLMSYQPSSSSSSSSSSSYRPIEPTYHSFGSRLQIVPYQELQQSLTQNGVAHISAKKKRKADAAPPNPNMLNLQQASGKPSKKKPKPPPAPKRQKQDDEKKHKLLITPSDQLGPAAIKKKAAVAHEVVVKKGLALTRSQWMTKRFIERMRPELKLPDRANEDFYTAIRDQNTKPDGLFYNEQLKDLPHELHFEWYFYCQSPLTSKKISIGPCLPRNDEDHKKGGWDCVHVMDHVNHCGGTSLDSEKVKQICPSARFNFEHQCGRRPVLMRNKWFDTLCDMLTLDEWNALQRTSHAAQTIYRDRGYGLAMKPYRQLLAIHRSYGPFLRRILLSAKQPHARFHCFVDRLLLQNVPASSRMRVWRSAYELFKQTDVGIDHEDQAVDERASFLRMTRLQAAFQLGTGVYKLDPPTLAYIRTLVLWTRNCTFHAAERLAPEAIVRTRGKTSPAAPPMFETYGTKLPLSFVEWFSPMEESVEINKRLAGLHFACSMVKVDPSHAFCVPMVNIFDAYCDATIDLYHGYLYTSIANFPLHLFFRKCMKYMDEWKGAVTKKKGQLPPPGVDSSSVGDFQTILKAEISSVYPTAKANQVTPTARNQPILSFRDEWSATLNHLRDDSKRTAPSALVQSMLCEVAHVVCAYLES